VLTRLGVSFLLALTVGWDRERRAALMAIRTFPIVAMASCGYILEDEGADVQRHRVGGRGLTAPPGPDEPSAPGPPSMNVRPDFLEE